MSFHAWNSQAPTAAGAALQSVSPEDDLDDLITRVFPIDLLASSFKPASTPAGTFEEDTRTGLSLTPLPSTQVSPTTVIEVVPDSLLSSGDSDSPPMPIASQETADTVEDLGLNVLPLPYVSDLNPSEFKALRDMFDFFESHTNHTPTINADSGLTATLRSSPEEPGLIACPALQDRVYPNVRFPSNTPFTPLFLLASNGRLETMLYLSLAETLHPYFCVYGSGPFWILEASEIPVNFRPAVHSIIPTLVDVSPPDNESHFRQTSVDVHTTAQLDVTQPVPSEASNSAMFIEPSALAGRPFFSPRFIFQGRRFRNSSFADSTADSASASYNSRRASSTSTAPMARDSRFSSTSTAPAQETLITAAGLEADEMQEEKNMCMIDSSLTDMEPPAQEGLTAEHSTMITASPANKRRRVICAQLLGLTPMGDDRLEADLEMSPEASFLPKAVLHPTFLHAPKHNVEIIVLPSVQNLFMAARFVHAHGSPFAIGTFNFNHTMNSNPVECSNLARAGLDFVWFGMGSAREDFLESSKKKELLINLRVALASMTPIVPVDDATAASIFENIDNGMKRLFIAYRPDWSLPRVQLEQDELEGIVSRIGALKAAFAAQVGPGAPDVMWLYAGHHLDGGPLTMHGVVDGFV